MDTKPMEDNVKPANSAASATCTACNHEHKEADGSCSCGCKMAKK